MRKKRQKIAFLILILLIVVFSILVYGKLKKTNTDTQENTEQLIKPQTHVVGNVNPESTQANGTVVAKNSTTIIASAWGIVETLFCTPWQEVQTGDKVAILVPAKDLQTDNLTLQKDSLGRQIGVVSDALNAWLKNVDLQISSLQQQKETNQRQLALLQQNLANLQQQKRLSADDMSIQRESLQTQLDNLKAQQITDQDKTQAALSTQIQGMKTNANAWLVLVDKTFGITDPDTAKYSKVYIWGKDVFAVNKVESNYYTIRDTIANLDKVSPSQVGNDIQTIVSYFTHVSDTINKSIVDNRYLTQVQIDTLYSTFTNITNWLLQAKSGLDATIAWLSTIEKTYDSQITSLENQLISFDKNKWEMSDIAMDSQINGVQSQINSLQLAIDSSDNQLATLQNSKSIQTQQTNIQLIGLEQSYNTLKNNLWGEELVSPIAGVVKIAGVTLWNKVWPGTPVCVIGQKNTEWLKIQFFSSQDLSVGKDVSVYINEQFVGSGKIDTKGAFVDPVTQNNSYELLKLKFSPLYREGQKVTVRFSSEQLDNTIRIPLSFLTPRLDGNYITKQIKNWETTDTQLVKVDIGEINNNMIRILSGLHIGDIIQK